MRMMRILTSSWHQPTGEHRKLESGALPRSASSTFSTDLFLSLNILAWRWRFGVSKEVFSAAKQVVSVQGLAGYRFFIQDKVIGSPA